MWAQGPEVSKVCRSRWGEEGQWLMNEFFTLARNWGWRVMQRG